MLTYIDRELDRNAGRIRYDYLQRLQASVAKFEKELSAAVAMIADNLRLVLESGDERVGTEKSVIRQLDQVIAQCSFLVACPNRESKPQAMPPVEACCSTDSAGSYSEMIRNHSGIFAHLCFVPHRGGVDPTLHLTIACVTS